MVAPSHSLESQDTQLFIAGFNAYQKKEYRTAAEKMSQVLATYPDTQLRDMAIFWLGRASYKAGDKDAGARHMAQFFREYPENPLKGTVEEELAALATAYAKSDKAAEEARKADAQISARREAAVEKADLAKLEADRRAKEQAEVDRVELERLALERAHAKKLAQEKADEENRRLFAEKAAAERAELEKAEAERIARATAEEEQKRAAAEKAAAASAAEEAAAKARLAARKAEAERLAREREEAAQKRLAAEKAAVEQRRLADEKKKTARVAAKRKPVKPVETARDQAIGDYRKVIDASPGSSAAVAASAKLKAMGVDYPPNGSSAKASTPQPPVTTQVLNLEVGQFVDVEFNVDTVGQVFPAGRRITIPFDVVNRGNGDDSFYLESGFPQEYGVQFFSSDNIDAPVNLTPTLSPGQRFKGALALTIPKGTIDGQKISFPVKLASRYARDVSQSRQVTMIASVPLLKAVITADKREIAPGEKVTYRVTVLNIGSAPASGIQLRMNFPPLYEPVDFMPAGFKQEMKAALILDGLKLESGESRELSMTFQLKDEAIARQELFLRGDLINNDLETSDSFVSAVSLVQGISGVTARSTSDRLLVIPGQTVTIPLIVTNTGNQREDFPIRPDIPATVAYTLYQDLNRDGIRQATDPVINHVGPLSPREEAYVILELRTPASESDGAVLPLAITFESEHDRKKSASVPIRLAYSRPLVDLAMTGRGGRLRPGEVATFDLTCTNRGSSIAKVVEMRSVLPEALELVASDPSVSRGKGGEYVWKFEELGAGERKGARVSIRVKPGVAVGTNLQVKNLLSYQDQLGNLY